MRIFSVYFLILGAPKKNNSRIEKKQNVKAISRSYIDIDASDPFKVPKSSQYIDQPVPEFTHRADKGDAAVVDVDDDDSEPPPKQFDNIQDDLKHLGLDNVASAGDESRFRNNESSEEPPPAGQREEQPVTDQETGSIRPRDTEDNDQPMKGILVDEDPQSRQYVPHDEYDDANRNKSNSNNDDDDWAVINNRFPQNNFLAVITSKEHFQQLAFTSSFFSIGS